MTCYQPPLRSYCKTVRRRDVTSHDDDDNDNDAGQALSKTKRHRLGRNAVELGAQPIERGALVTLPAGVDHRHGRLPGDIG